MEYRNQHIKSTLTMEITSPYCDIENHKVYCNVIDRKSEVQSIIEISDKDIFIIEEIRKQGDFFQYLSRAATIHKLRRGDGAFIGNSKVAPDDFKRFGIILPKGGMMLKDISFELVKSVVDEQQEEITRLKDSIKNEIKRKMESHNPLLAIHDLWSGVKYNGCEVFSLGNLDELEDYLRTEREIKAVREKYYKQINGLQKKLEGDYWRLKALHYQNSDEDLYFYHTELIKFFEISHAIGFNGKVYRWTESDIQDLFIDVRGYLQEQTKRMNLLFTLFKRNNFRFHSEEKSTYFGNSMMNGKARYDERTSYYLFGNNGERIEILPHERKYLLEKTKKL